MSQSFTIPKHPIPFRDGFWVLRANHRALHELEHLHGGHRSFREIFANPDGSFTFEYKLLWALSVTHRAGGGQGVTFEEWLEHLPTGDAWEALIDKAYEMLTEALPKKKPPAPAEEDPEGYAEDPEGNLAPAPSEPVQPNGDTSFTSPSS